MKAIVLLKYFKTKKGTTYKMRCKVNEAIAELEAIENRSYENCKHDYVDVDDNCQRCNGYHEDKFELKE